MAIEDPRLATGTDTNDKIICLAEVAMSTPAGVAVTSGTPVKIAGTTAGVFETNGLAVTSQGRITYKGPPGTFLVVAQAGLSASSDNNANPILYLAKNGTFIPGTRMRKTTNRSNETGSQSLNWNIELERDDYIELFVDADTSDTITAETMILSLIG